jgi:hypothetical protein
MASLSPTSRNSSIMDERSQSNKNCRHYEYQNMAVPAFSRNTGKDLSSRKKNRNKTKENTPIKELPLSKQIPKPELCNDELKVYSRDMPARKIQRHGSQSNVPNEYTRYGHNQSSLSKACTRTFKMANKLPVSHRSIQSQESLGRQSSGSRDGPHLRQHHPYNI